MIMVTRLARMQKPLLLMRRWNAHLGHDIHTESTVWAQQEAPLQASAVTCDHDIPTDQDAEAVFARAQLGLC